MKIRLITLFLILLGICSYMSAQNFNSQFDEFKKIDDTSGMRILLEKWQKEMPDDPDKLVACYKYYARISNLGTVVAYFKQNENDTVNSEPTVRVDTLLLKRGVDCIDEGIRKYPARLDMRFQKVNMFWHLERYTDYTIEMIRIIQYSDVIKNKWLWENGEILEDGKKQMLGNIQEYVLQLYNTGRYEILEKIKLIAEEVLKFYPDHLESLTNLSVVHLQRNENDEALNVLFKAEKLAPTDQVVLNNLALAYKQKGDMENAVKFYELVLKYGDKDYQTYAKSQIEELKK